MTISHRAFTKDTDDRILATFTLVVQYGSDGNGDRTVALWDGSAWRSSGFKRDKGSRQDNIQWKRSVIYPVTFHSWNNMMVLTLVPRPRR